MHELGASASDNVSAHAGPAITNPRFALLYFHYCSHALLPDSPNYYHHHHYQPTTSSTSATCPRVPISNHNNPNNCATHHTTPPSTLDALCLSLVTRHCTRNVHPPAWTPTTRTCTRICTWCSESWVHERKLCGLHRVPARGRCGGPEKCKCRYLSIVEVLCVPITGGRCGLVLSLFDVAGPKKRSPFFARDNII